WASGREAGPQGALMSLRQILQSPYKSQRTRIHGGCTTRASAAGMTARASSSVARASVTRFIENLPCNHRGRREERSTDGGEYSWPGRLCQREWRGGRRPQAESFLTISHLAGGEGGWMPALCLFSGATPAAETRRSARTARHKPATPAD